MKIQFPHKLIVAHLNIKSIWKKFYSVFKIENNADISLISETKLYIYLKCADLVRLIDMIEIQWVVDFYVITKVTLK